MYLLHFGFFSRSLTNMPSPLENVLGSLTNSGLNFSESLKSVNGHIK